MKKVVENYGDKFKINFGGLIRKGKNNVFFNLKQKICRNIIGIGYAAHIVHNRI
jgi:ribosomal protein S17E